MLNRRRGMLCGRVLIGEGNVVAPLCFGAVAAGFGATVFVVFVAMIFSFIS